MTYTNNADKNQTPQNAASDHCLDLNYMYIQFKFVKKRKTWPKQYKNNCCKGLARLIRKGEVIWLMIKVFKLTHESAKLYDVVSELD